MKQERVEALATMGQQPGWEGTAELAREWLTLHANIDEAQVQILELSRERDRLAIEVEAQRERADDAEEDILSLRRDEEYIWQKYRDDRERERRVAWDMYAAVAAADIKVEFEDAAEYADGLLAERDKRWPVEVRDEQYENPPIRCGTFEVQP